MTIAKALNDLKEELKALHSSESWQRYLLAQSVFWQYSFHNVLLILRQCPHASMVTGFRGWQKLGRWVRKGEKGIVILAPIFRKVEDGDEEKAIGGFKPVYVFDISQTDGKPLPDIEKKLPKGDNPQLFAKLEQVSSAMGLKLLRKKIKPAQGIYSRSRQEIILDEGLGGIEAIQTLIHELAHHVLEHNERRIKHNQCEIEAEGVCYVVCRALGIETGNTNAIYIGGYSKSPEDIERCGKMISEGSRKILQALEEK